MTTYVYKVNKKPGVGYHHGNWEEFFDRPQPSGWGLADVVCKDHKPDKGDRIIAYQTNLNEVIGTATVDGYSRGRLMLTATEGPFPRGVKIRDLKTIDERIGNLEAFQQGLIKTLYPISDRDADHLLATSKRYWIDNET